MDTKTVQGSPKNLQKTSRFIISQIFFHLFCAENGDGKRPSQEHLKNPKTSRGS
jgi:hypothetical protein